MTIQDMEHLRVRYVYVFDFFLFCFLVFVLCFELKFLGALCVHLNWFSANECGDVFGVFELWQPSELNTYYDIEAVYHCLKREYGIKQEELILYGQSVGSGPTLHLASKLQKLRGVVLHSAILSGIRVLYPVKMTFWFDIFKVSFSLSVHNSHHSTLIFSAQLCSNEKFLF